MNRYKFLKGRNHKSLSLYLPLTTASPKVNLEEKSNFSKFGTLQDFSTQVINESADER